MHISRLAFGCTYEQHSFRDCPPAVLRREILGGATAIQPPHAVADESLGGTVCSIRLTPSEQMSHAKNSCAGRFTAVNLTNADTVEIRMFRGTLKLNTLKATLQMVNHLVEVAVAMSDAAVQDMSWFDFLDDITEPELIQYLKERRLYVNEPVSASEEVICAVFFGLIDSKVSQHSHEEQNPEHSARECQVRGTDATGIAYNFNDRLRIYKRPLPARKMKIHIPHGVNVVMGHTRMTTQGNAQFNQNNHPFLTHHVDGINPALCPQRRSLE